MMTVSIILMMILIGPHVSHKTELKWSRAPPSSSWRTLKRSLSFWRSVCRPKSWVLRWIKDGLSLHWKHAPPFAPAEFPNVKTAHDHSEFVDECVSEMLAAGLVCISTDKPLVVSPLGGVP